MEAEVRRAVLYFERRRNGVTTETRRSEPWFGIDLHRRPRTARFFVAKPREFGFDSGTQASQRSLEKIFWENPCRSSRRRSLSR